MIKASVSEFRDLQTCWGWGTICMANFSKVWGYFGPISSGNESLKREVAIHLPRSLLVAMAVWAIDF